MIESTDLPSVPRPVQVATKWRQSTYLWAIFSIVVGIIALLWTIQIVRERFSLAANAEKVEGTIVDRNETSGKTTSYWLLVDYSLRGAGYKKRFRVGSGLYGSTNYGDKVSVYADRTDPANASLEPITRDEATESERNYALAYLGGVVVVCLSFYAARNEAEKQCKRLAEWPLSMLSVTKVRSTDSRSGGLKVTGTILDQKGQPVQVVDLSVSSDVHVDRPIPVLIDPYSDRIVALDSIKAAEIAR